MASEVRKDKKRKEGKKKVVVLAVIVAIVIAVLVGIIIYLLGKKDKTEEVAEETRRNVVVTPDNVDEVIQQMQDNSRNGVNQGYYTITQNSTWHFKSGKAISEDAYVENVAENTNAVYFDVVMADDNEHKVLESPVIPIGSHLENIALDEELSKGTYDCVIVYHLVDDNQNTISTVSVTVTIIIEN